MVEQTSGTEGPGSKQLIKEDQQTEGDLIAQLDILEQDPLEFNQEGDSVPAFLKGVFINGKKRSYFMLDTETDLVHFFRKSKDNKPY